MFRSSLPLWSGPTLSGPTITIHENDIVVEGMASPPHSARLFPLPVLLSAECDPDTPACKLLDNNSAYSNFRFYGAEYRSGKFTLTFGESPDYTGTAVISEATLIALAKESTPSYF